MDELDEKVLDMFHKYRDAGGPDDVVIMSRTDFDRNAKLYGYIKLPGNAQNVTITTSDNPNDKLMTREQWEQERG